MLFDEQKTNRIMNNKLILFYFEVSKFINFKFKRKNISKVSKVYFQFKLNFFL